MKETAFNLHWPVLKADFQKFHAVPQRNLPLGYEYGEWKYWQKPGICLRHPPVAVVRVVYNTTPWV